jgi:hypothetical protein
MSTRHPVSTFLASLLLGACTQAQADPPRSAAAGGFAVVELFTSEGCSSCPPADALLAELGREAARTKTPVHTLSFHVDYWNHLGWRDPWSAAWASSRQRAYAAALRDNVYTPQMVVNGRHAFIGSYAAEARSTIAAALAENPALNLSLTAAAAADNVRVDVALSAPPPPNSLLHVALVEASAKSRVASGENEGRELIHANVVRDFTTVRLQPAQRSANVSLTWPKGLSRADASVVAYVQDAKSFAIVAATRGNP